MLGIALFTGAFSDQAAGMLAGVGALYLAIGVLMLLVARGVRQLKPWARTTSTVLAAIGLLGFPLGTLVNAYILYLMLSKKGKRIFAGGLQGHHRGHAARQIPHVHHRVDRAGHCCCSAFIGIIAALALGRG